VTSPRSLVRPAIAVVIPAHNEESALPLVLADLPIDQLSQIIVVDNASTDETAQRARAGGAQVVYEARRGYGSACLAGMAALAPHIEIVVFLDADYSDHPEQLPLLTAPISDGAYDFVVGSRSNPGCEPGAMLPQAKVGNQLAVYLIAQLFGFRYTDLGPFRAIRRHCLDQLGMCDTSFGWTVEMQIKAIVAGLRVTEVPVRYRKRIGHSKITGTWSGTIRAGYKILATIYKYGHYLD
jgi:hypothetical protein